MTTGLLVLLLVLAAATAFGLWRRRTDGHFRGGRDEPADTETHLPTAEQSDWGEDDHNPHDLVRTRIGAAVPAEAYGERATLVQFSSAFCAPCRVARRVLGEVAEVVPGVTHVEIDAESQLETVRALGIRRTPTTIIVGPDGREVSRALGAPSKDQVIAALGQVV